MAADAAADYTCEIVESGVQAVAPGEQGPVALNFNCNPSVIRTAQVPKQLDLESQWVLQ